MSVNKIIIASLLLIALLSQWVFAQQDTIWQADFWVEHPAGYSDTITLGAAENGGWGLQANLDEKIDTNFTTPISILSYDSVIYEQYNTCPGNVQRNIMGFEQTVNYAFYVKSDSFPYINDFPPADSVTSLHYDIDNFSFTNSSYQIENVSIYSEGGYMNAVDGTNFCLYSGGNIGCSGTYNDNKQYLALIYEQNPGDYLGRCGTADKVIKFFLEVRFSKLTSFKPPPSLASSIDFHHYSTKKAIRLRFPNRLSGSLQITDLAGRVLKRQPFSNIKNREFTYNLQPGLYLASVQANGQITSFKFFVPKNNQP